MRSVAKHLEHHRLNGARAVVAPSNTLPVLPAVAQPARWVGAVQRVSYCAFLQQQMEAWDNDRRKSYQSIDIKALARTPKIGGSTFAPPWDVEVVPDTELQALKAETDSYAESHARSNTHRSSLRLAQPLPDGRAIFGMGREKTAKDTNHFDGYRGALESALITVRAGERMPDELEFSPYDVRAFKYLFAINRFGLHLVREMTPCSATVRGFPGHPQVAECAAAGGEAFFTEPGKVVINLGSGRFPVEDIRAAEAVAKYFLACGVNEVTVLYSERDFSVEPYSLKDRYGQDLPNKVFVRANPVSPEMGRAIVSGIQCDADDEPI